MQLALGRVAPHGLRRSCARLCRTAGGEYRWLLGNTQTRSSLTTGSRTVRRSSSGLEVATIGKNRYYHYSVGEAEWA